MLARKVLKCIYKTSYFEDRRFKDDSSSDSKSVYLEFGFLCRCGRPLDEDVGSSFTLTCEIGTAASSSSNVTLLFLPFDFMSFLGELFGLLLRASKKKTNSKTSVLTTVLKVLTTFDSF